MSSLRCLFLVAGMLALPRVVRAEPSSGSHRELRLSWVRSTPAASCPDAGHVEADVERRLGWSPFSHGSAASESIEALVTHESDTWRAVIELRAADGRSLGSRTVESAAANCASLSAAAGLAMALMIEPLLPAQTESRPLAAATPATPAAAATPATAPPKPSSNSPALAERSNAPEARALRGRGGLLLGAFAATRVLPSAALGGTVIGNVELVDHLFGAVSASWLPEQHVRRNDADVGFGMTLGAIGPCYHLPIGVGFSVSSCLSLLLASLQITVVEPEPVAPGARFWWAASTGLRLGWSSGAFEAGLGVDALAHPTRHRYLIDHSEPNTEASFFVEPALALTGVLAAGVHY
jgi:hypothetical protein